MTTMEDLTKTQIVLLTLLVSFVTSIATGIITTSLLAEAPASITQTINRVVEHTIERVAPEIPATPTKPATPGTTVKEVTVVKEEDAIIDSIAKTSPVVVRIKQSRSNGRDQAFYGLGVIVSTDGLIVSDRRALYERPEWTAVLADGTVRELELVSKDDTTHLTLFKIVPTDGLATAFTPAAFSQNDLKLGQSVIAIEGIEKNVVAVGRVLGVNTGTETASSSTAPIVYSVDTDIASNEISGGPLLNLSGELVGLKTSAADYTLPSGSYTTLASVRRLISAPRE